MSQCGTQIATILGAPARAMRVAKVMPDAQANRGHMLVLKAPAAVGDMLNGGVPVQIAAQQAWQAAAIDRNGIHALPLVLASSRSLTDHPQTAD